MSLKNRHVTHEATSGATWYCICKQISTAIYELKQNTKEFEKQFIP